jgi:hypothetical protein
MKWVERFFSVGVAVLAALVMVMMGLLMVAVIKDIWTYL